MAILFPPPAIADEFSTIDDSAVIGRNFGYPGMEVMETGSLELAVEGVFFTKNLEILGDVKGLVVGRTYNGYRAPLTLRYRPHEKVSLEGGLKPGHDYGDDDPFDMTAPIVRLAYKPYGGVFLITGTLLSTHPMHDALYDDTLSLGRKTEEGIQIRADREHIKHDTWMNWKVRETPERPEQFDIGSVTQLRFGGLYLDGQAIWVHTGGQINNPRDSIAHKVEHNLYFLAGGSYGRALGKKINDLRLGGYYIHGSDSPDVDSGIGDSSGGGFEGRLTVDITPKDNLHLRLFGSHYTGEDVLARQGDPLYMLDDYSQLGMDIILRLPAGLALESALTLQWLEGDMQHTEQLYLSWSKAFRLR